MAAFSLPTCFYEHTFDPDLTGGVRRNRKKVKTEFFESQEQGVGGVNNHFFF